jgi:hypothetical protein
MNHAETIESAVRQAQDMLWENVPSTHNLPDHGVLEKICDLITARPVKEAIDIGGNTYLASVLKAVRFTLARSYTSDRATITALWPILDDPSLNRALRIKPSSRVNGPPS